MPFFQENCILVDIKHSSCVPCSWIKYTSFHHYIQENIEKNKGLLHNSLDIHRVVYIVERLSFCLSLLKKSRRSRKYEKYKGTSYELSHGSSNMMLVFAELWNDNAHHHAAIIFIYIITLKEEKDWSVLGCYIYHIFIISITQVDIDGIDTI